MAALGVLAMDLFSALAALVVTAPMPTRLAFLFLILVVWDPFFLDPPVLPVMLEPVTTVGGVEG